MANTSVCPSEDQLKSFARGELNPPSKEQLESHVRHCRLCAETLDSLRNDDTKASRAGQTDEVRHQSSAEVDDIEIEGPDAGEVAFDETPPPPDESPPPEEMIQRTVYAVSPGDQVGPYRIVARIGRGGMGYVYRAVHQKLDKPVALKFLPNDRLRSDAAIERFLREIKAAGRLDHPNLVRATDAGEAGGHHFLVMELIEGQNLAELCKRHGPLPVAEACELARQAALGLQYVHDQGWIHRDLKPSNLMLTPSGTVKLLDLGLALLNEAADEPLTSNGAPIGTVDYMAPEQASSSHQVDSSADLYSLGCTLYQLLCGHPPFAGPEFDSTVKRLMAHAQQEPLPVRELRPDVDEDVAQLVQRLLAKDPADRPARADEVVAALARWEQTAKPSQLLTEQIHAPHDKRSFPQGNHVKDSLGSSTVSQPSPLIGQPKAVKQRPWHRWLVATSTVIVAAIIMFVGFVIIRDKFGRELARVQVPEDGSVEIEFGSQLPTAQPSNNNHWRSQINSERESGIFEKTPSKILYAPEWVWSEPINLGRVLNTERWEYRPELSSDGLTLIFDVQREDGLGGRDLWVTTRDSQSDVWGPPQPLDPPINSEFEERGACLLPDQKSLVFTSNRPGGQGGQDLWISMRETTTAPWGEPVNLGETVNSEANESYATATPDGLTLIFNSNRVGTHSYTDLWMTRRASLEATWSKPVNLGEIVNCEGCSEEEPELSSDGLALLFWTYPCIHSMKAGGRGRADLQFCIREDSDSAWSLPFNLGEGVNGPEMDKGAALSVDCRTLIFTSSRAGGFGKSDLWMSRRVRRGDPDAAVAEAGAD